MCCLHCSITGQTNFRLTARIQLRFFHVSQNYKGKTTYNVLAIVCHFWSHTRIRTEHSVIFLGIGPPSGGGFPSSRGHLSNSRPSSASAQRCRRRPQVFFYRHGRGPARRRLCYDGSQVFCHALP